MSNIVTRDLGWKLFSLALAIVIWITVKTASDEGTRSGGILKQWDRREFSDQPVLVLSAAADVRQFKVAPDNVDIVVSGPPDIVAALQEKDVHVAVDLTQITSAQDLRKRVDVSTPPGVTVVSVSPAEVDVVVPPKPDSELKP